MLGRTQFTLIPLALTSSASVRVRAMTPAFAALYAAWRGAGITAVRDEMLTIRPDFRSSMCGRTARLHRNAEVRLRVSIPSHSSTGVSWSGRPPFHPPTMFSSASTCLNSRSAWAMRSAAPRAVVTSYRTGIHRCRASALTHRVHGHFHHVARRNARTFVKKDPHGFAAQGAGRAGDDHDFVGEHSGIHAVTSDW